MPRARPLGDLHFGLFFAHVPNRAPASTRLPRRKSAAEILFRPAACTSSSLSRPVPHWTTGLGFTLTIVPGGSSLEPESSIAARQSRTSSPPRRVRATGHGSYARVIRSICTALAVQSITASFFSTCAVYVAIASSCGVSTSAPRAARSIASSIASAPSSASFSFNVACVSLDSTGILRCKYIGPASIRSTIRMIVTPVSASPDRIAPSTGAAPR